MIFNPIFINPKIFTMKNFFLLILFTLFISCIEETSVDLQSENISVELSFDHNPSSAAFSTKNSDSKQRILVEVYWYNNNEMIITDKKILLLDQLSGTHKVDFKLQLNQSYRLLIWSDLSNAGGNDLFYNTSNSLQNVTSILDDNDVYSNPPEKRDAFFAAKDIVVNSQDQLIEIILSRACSLVKIDAQDLHDDSLEKRPVSSVLKLKAPSQFDVSTGLMSEEQNFEVHYTISEETIQNEVLAFYLLAPDSHILNTIETSYFDSNAGLIVSREFSNLPLKRNFRTILTGNIFTSDVKVDVSIDSNFSEPENENDNIVFDNSANSFILHPSSKPVKYSIPVTHQNEYWGSIEPSNVISESTKWNTHIIWSELNEGDFVIQASELPLYTDIIVNPGAKGNALLGVYNDMNANNIQDGDEPYLWSYHLWITDYNPDQSISILSGKYDYAVNGGTVQRIPGNKWNESSYSSARLMDRNLGELSTNYSEERRGILYYQYGRKDPFPFTLLSNKDCNNVVSMQNSISKPNMLYTKEYLQSGKKIYRWTEDNIGSGFIWSDLSSKDKSIFDPCPYGWSLPSHLDFADILLLNKTDIENYITYGDIIQFRKSGFVGASQLVLNEMFNFLLLSDLNISAPYNPFVINLGEKKFSDIFRSTGLPVRCIKRN